jgi:RNA polymerase sigma factor (sigma-70 family)
MTSDDPQKLDQTAADADGRRERTELVERLFREHNEALIRFLMSRLRSYQDAREVAQEAYVRLLSLDEPGAVSYLRAFLFKTAANLAVDRRRRDAAHARATDQPLFQEFADVRTPERRAADRQVLQRLERLIAALPAKCRQAFVLYEFDGLEFAAIARSMGISERMVRKYVVRALLHCRTQLDLGNPPGGEDSRRVRE